MSTVLITGAAKRLGQSLALFLAKHGYDIALHCHKSKKEAESLRKEINKLGQKCSVFYADLSVDEEMCKLIDDVNLKMGVIEVLIHNASNFYPCSFRDTSLSDWSLLFDVHLKSAYFLAQKFVEKSTFGNIIFFTDANLRSSGRISNHFVYTLSKRSVSFLVEMLARELAPDFRVNSIAPGRILDPEIKDRISDFSESLDKVPLKKKGSVKDINESVLFLLKEKYFTGQVLYVDGGRHLNG